jgi:cytochrome c oxidase subunit 1
MFGRMMDERLGKVHFYLTFVGAYSTFLPMHFAGFAGNPRRYSDFTTFTFLARVMPLQRWITYSAFFLASVQVIFLWNLARSIRGGAMAKTNPWQATSLEWSEYQGPVVRGPYDYSVPGAAKDYLVQNEPG